MSDMIDGNMIALSRHEKEMERQEALCEERNSLITHISDRVQEAIDILRNPEELEELSQIMDDGIEALENLLCELEEER